jgi:hypothetical protein
VMGWTRISLGGLLSADIPVWNCLIVSGDETLNWLVTVGRGRLQGRAKSGGASGTYVGER